MPFILPSYIRIFKIKEMYDSYTVHRAFHLSFVLPLSWNKQRKMYKTYKKVDGCVSKHKENMKATLHRVYPTKRS